MQKKSIRRHVANHLHQDVHGMYPIGQHVLASDTTELRLSLEKRLVRVWLLTRIREFVSFVYCRRPGGDELSSRHALQGLYAHMELIRQPTFSLSVCIDPNRCMCTLYQRAVRTGVEQVEYLIS